MENYKFGPNVIYFALGITEGRPAGAFWADQIVFRRPSKILHIGSEVFNAVTGIVETHQALWRVALISRRRYCAKWCCGVSLSPDQTLIA